mgnify:CR=1 FL=1
MLTKASRHYCAIAILVIFTVFGVTAACSFPAAPASKVTAPLADTTSPTISEEKLRTALAEGSVTQVLDVGLIEASISGKLNTIRYIGIDAPSPFYPNASTEYYAKEAQNKNYELVNGKTVLLEKDVSETDKKGRLLRYVWVNDTMINAELVKQGYAQVIGHSPDLKYYDLLVKLQIEAQQAGKGLWSLKDDLDSTTLIPGTFVGNIESKIYHYSSCELTCLISEQYRLPFSSANSALSRGYTACKVCKPPAKMCK